MGRPLIGAIWGQLFRSNGGWRSDTRLHRGIAVVTLGWSSIHAIRVVTQTVF